MPHNAIIWKTLHKCKAWKQTAPAEESSLTGKGPVNANSVHVHAVLCSMSRKDDEGDNERSHARHEGRVRLQSIRTGMIKGRIELQH